MFRTGAPAGYCWSEHLDRPYRISEKNNQTHRVWFGCAQTVTCFSLLLKPGNNTSGTSASSSYCWSQPLEEPYRMSEKNNQTHRMWFCWARTRTSFSLLLKVCSNKSRTMALASYSWSELLEEHHRLIEKKNQSGRVRLGWAQTVTCFFTPFGTAQWLVKIHCTCCLSLAEPSRGTY
jgi:ribosomal protein L28